MKPDSYVVVAFDKEVPTDELKSFVTDRLTTGSKNQAFEFVSSADTVIPSMRFSKAFTDTHINRTVNVNASGTYYTYLVMLKSDIITVQPVLEEAAAAETNANTFATQNVVFDTTLLQQSAKSTRILGSHEIAVRSNGFVNLPDYLDLNDVGTVYTYTITQPFKRGAELQLRFHDFEPLVMSRRTESSVTFENFYIEQDDSSLLKQNDTLSQLSQFPQYVRYTVVNSSDVPSIAANNYNNHGTPQYNGYNDLKIEFFYDEAYTQPCFHTYIGYCTAESVSFQSNTSAFFVFNKISQASIKNISKTVAPIVDLENTVPTVAFTPEYMPLVIKKLTEGSSFFNSSMHKYITGVPVYLKNGILYGLDENVAYTKLDVTGLKNNRYAYVYAISTNDLSGWNAQDDSWEIMPSAGCKVHNIDVVVARKQISPFQSEITFPSATSGLGVVINDVEFEIGQAKVPTVNVVSALKTTDQVTYSVSVAPTDEFSNNNFTVCTVLSTNPELSVAKILEYKNSNFTAAVTSTVASNAQTFEYTGTHVLDTKDTLRPVSTVDSLTVYVYAVDGLGLYSVDYKTVHVTKRELVVRDQSTLRMRSSYTTNVPNVVVSDTGVFTLMTKIKTNSNPVTQTEKFDLLFESTESDAYGICMQNNQLKIKSNDAASSAFYVSPDTWYTIVAVFANGSPVKAFINDTELGHNGVNVSGNFVFNKIALNNHFVSEIDFLVAFKDQVEIEESTLIDVSQFVENRTDVAFAYMFNKSVGDSQNALPNLNINNAVFNPSTTFTTVVDTESHKVNVTDTDFDVSTNTLNIAGTMYSAHFDISSYHIAVVPKSNNLSSEYLSNYVDKHTHFASVYSTTVHVPKHTVHDFTQSVHLAFSDVYNSQYGSISKDFYDDGKYNLVVVTKDAAEGNRHVTTLALPHVRDLSAAEQAAAGEYNNVKGLQLNAYPQAFVILQQTDTEGNVSSIANQSDELSYVGDSVLAVDSEGFTFTTFNQPFPLENSPQIPFTTDTNNNGFTVGMVIEVENGNVGNVIELDNQTGFGFVGDQLKWSAMSDADSAIDLPAEAHNQKLIVIWRVEQGTVGNKQKGVVKWINNSTTYRKVTSGEFAGSAVVADSYGFTNNSYKLYEFRFVPAYVDDIDMENMEAYFSNKYYSRNWTDVIGLWPLNEQTGLRDVSGNERHFSVPTNAAYSNVQNLFTTHNNRSCIDFGRTARSGNVVFPSGNYVYNKLSNGEQWSNIVQGSNAFTLTFWWSVDSMNDASNTPFVNWGQGTNHVIKLDNSEKDGDILLNGESPFGQSANTIKTNGEWQHYAIVWNGTTTELYIDGVKGASISSAIGSLDLAAEIDALTLNSDLSATATISALVSQTSDIQNSVAGNSTSNARYSDIRLFRSAKTQEEIQTIYGYASVLPRVHTLTTEIQPSYVAVTDATIKSASTTGVSKYYLFTVNSWLFNPSETDVKHFVHALPSYTSPGLKSDNTVYFSNASVSANSTHTVTPFMLTKAFTSFSGFDFTENVSNVPGVYTTYLVSVDNNNELLVTSSAVSNESGYLSAQLQMSAPTDSGLYTIKEASPTRPTWRCL